MNFTVIAIIAFFGVEIALVGASALLYSRMRAKADAERAASVPWGIKVEAAVGTAQSAKDTVERLKLEHYDNLRNLFESQVLQIAQLKGEIVTLRKEVEQLTTKVQTLQRGERREAKRAADQAVAEDGASPLPGPEVNGVPFPGGASPEPGRRRFGHIP